MRSTPTALVLLLLVAALVPSIYGQDPAQGWLGYAMTSYPTGIITYIEAKWRVPSNPVVSGAFFSPWFGIEASDNLNLIQPVNPWTGNGWQIYNEYFQWQPTYNYNSKAHNVNAGDVLFGSVTYNAANHTYTVYHSDLNDGWSVTTNIPIQQNKDGSFKEYNIAYFVMEKVWQCNQYPPDGKVVFYDIKIQYNQQTVVPKWTTGVVDDVCNCRAHVLNSTAISITWDTN